MESSHIGDCISVVFVGKKEHSVICMPGGSGCDCMGLVKR